MRLTFFLILLSFLFSCGKYRPFGSIVDAFTGATVDTANGTNSTFDNEKLYELCAPQLVVEGDVYQPGTEDFKNLYKRSVVVRECKYGFEGKEGFVGAYRYEGYSLFDILNKRVLKKANKEEFKPEIDVYVVVENAKGEKAVFSWGEIFLAARPHTILLATDVSRIVPHKSKDQWPLPEQCRMVVANDLYCERYIENPTKITVVTAGKHYEINRDLDPLISESIQLIDNDTIKASFTQFSENVSDYEAHVMFFGMGRGIHDTKPVVGKRMKDCLALHFPPDAKKLRSGFFIVAGLDGYRTVYSYSEIFNRNDQSDILILPCNGNGGKFRSSVPADFYADRSIKALKELYFVAIP